MTKRFWLSIAALAIAAAAVAYYQFGEVVAEAPVINRFESTSAGTITSDVASNVTSLNSNYYSALALLPGVTSDGDLADEYPGTNGSRWMEAAVFVDGVDTTYTRRGGSRLYLPQIAVSSTSLQSTSGSA